jgi:hypothetical protein
MRLNKTKLSALSVVFLSGCATMGNLVTPTVQVTKRYEVHQITAAQGVTATKISAAIKSGLQTQVKGVVITDNLPPSPLPETSPRFQIVDPLKSFGGLGAMAAASGQNMERATCDGAMVYANGQESSKATTGEETRITVCLWAYKGGYHLDIFTLYSKESGGLNPMALARGLTQSVMGDNSQFIPRTINAVLDNIKNTGAQIQMIEKYPE